MTAHAAARRPRSGTRRTEKTECVLSPAEKRRLLAAAARYGLSEAGVVRMALLQMLDSEGIGDPGEQEQEHALAAA